MHTDDFRFNRQGKMPTKNIVDDIPVKPLRLEFNANVEGDWFHCHILLPYDGMEWGF